MKPTKTKPQRNTAVLLSLFARFLFILLVLLIGTLPACQTAANQPTAAAKPAKTFESDGCSRVPDGPHSDPNRWHPACAEHDLAYWNGGSRRDRLNADRQLKAAIKKSGSPLTAEIYFIGIRLGGSPYFPTPWRWGFNRSWPSAYHQTALDDDGATPPQPRPPTQGY